MSRIIEGNFGFEIFVSGILLGGKIWKVFFLSIKVGIFMGITVTGLGCVVLRIKHNIKGSVPECLYSCSIVK